MIDRVLIELRAGRKQSHWMWFVFPQLVQLGQSPTAKHYGIADLAEAGDYLDHPVLGPRLVECTQLVMAAHPKTALQILGTPDDLKFRSCCTLFGAVPCAPADFIKALDLFYDGPDPRTEALLRQ